MSNVITEKENKLNNRVVPTLCPETDVHGADIETSIKTFSNSLSPKFIRSIVTTNTQLHLQEKNFGNFIQKSSSLELPSSKNGKQTSVDLIPKSCLKKSVVIRKPESSFLSSSSEDSNKDTTKMGESEIRKKFTFSKVLKRDSLRPEIANIGPKRAFSRLTSLSNMVSEFNDDDFFDENGDDESSSSRNDFSLRSFNDATMSQFLDIGNMTDESLENQIFPNDAPNDKYTSLILLPNGDTQKVDKRELLAQEKTGSGILKFRNEKVRRKTKRMLEDVEEECDPEEVARRGDKKKTSVRFGKMMKIYHFNPKRKVAIKRNATKYGDGGRT